MNWNLVGSTYGRFCIKFPHSRIKGEWHPILTTKIGYIISRKRSQRVPIFKISHIWKVYSALLFFMQFWCGLFLLIECAESWYIVLWSQTKGPTSAKFQNFFLILHPNIRGLSWSWSYGSWIYNHLCN
jgi:hypothetical protein